MDPIPTIIKLPVNQFHYEMTGDVGLVEGDAVVADEEELGHGVDFVAIVLALFFGAEVVEADAQCGLSLAVGGVVSVLA